MAILSTLPALLLSLAALSEALTPAQWRKESIYQVMTDRFARTDVSTTAGCNLGEYCGGTFQGLIKKLDYIQGMGFTAIWISPIVKNVEGNTPDGSSYHGYWAQDIYSINPHFGSASDLKALSSALHQRGMHLMVDIVTNHMGSISSRANVDYSQLNPFNQKSQYHTPCDIDYSNRQSIIYCWEGDNTVALADIRTEDQPIRDTFNSWIKNLVSTYSIDGLRIDSMQQVEDSFWQPFQSAAGGIHAIGEVFNGDPNYMCPFQKSLSGLMNYPTYYTVTHAFQSTSGSMGDLANGINQMKSTCQDVTVLGSFLENHDNPRFPSLTSDNSLIKNAIGFTVLADGIPIVYQGQEQKFSGGNVPNNREALWTSGYNTGATFYKHIQILNKIRQWAITKDSTYLTYMAWPIQNDASTIVMRKGFAGQQVVSVFTNRGQNAGQFNLSVGNGNSGFTNGQAVTDVLSCTQYTVGSNSVTVTIKSGLPQVLFPTNALGGSGICGK